MSDGAGKAGDDFFAQLTAVLQGIDRKQVDAVATALAKVRDVAGRVFVLGVGGSAAIAAHTVIDLRKACGIEAYAPSDSAPELTARANDEGWDTVFAGWLTVSRLRAGDAVLIFSVGGGDPDKGTSLNIIAAVDLARQVGASVLGVVGKQTGHTGRHADAAVIVPQLYPARSGPLSLAGMSAVQKAVILHPVLAL